MTGTSTTGTSSTAVDTVAEEEFLARLREFVGQEATPTRVAQEPVNRPMIRHFVEAMGDENPVYLDEAAARASGREGIIAPPPMLMTWLMVGYTAHLRALEQGPVDTPNARLLGLLGDAGFTGVVATNDEHEYLRELRLGDHLSMTTVIESVSAQKRTGLGTGHFITTVRTYTDQHDEVVARQRFTIMRFAPKQAAGETGGPRTPTEAGQLTLRPKPFILRDNAFWFEAAKEERLVIQCCSDCGRLRHPPAPSCPHCVSFRWHEAPASGRGTVHSFVISHHPEAPGFDYPLAVLLVDLEEGTRLVADFAGDPATVAIGMSVEVDWVRYDAELTLPRFRTAEENS